jgi:hypothetical protein
LEEQKPVEEMTPVEMAQEITLRREGDDYVRALVGQIQVLKQILAQHGILVAFGEEESANLMAWIQEQQGGTNE